MTTPLCPTCGKPLEEVGTFPCYYCPSCQGVLEKKARYKIGEVVIDTILCFYIFDNHTHQYLRKDWSWSKYCNNSKGNGFYHTREEAADHLRAKLKRDDKISWSVQREKGEGK